MEEPLINLHPKTVHEKYLWEKLRTEELKKELKACKLELGMLKSEYDELLDTLKTSEVGALIIKNRNKSKQVNDLENRIKDLKKTNAALLQQTIKLQTK